MNKKETLEKLKKGELLMSDIAPEIKLTCLHAEGDGITSEMINQAKISKELYKQITKGIDSPYFLPYAICHYKDGVLYPYIRYRKSEET